MAGITGGAPNLAYHPRLRPDAFHSQQSQSQSQPHQQPPFDRQLDHQSLPHSRDYHTASDDYHDGNVSTTSSEQPQEAQQEQRRRGSFSFLRRSSSGARSTTTTTTPADAPPLPVTRITQAHVEAAAAAARKNTNTTATHGSYGFFPAQQQRAPSQQRQPQPRNRAFSSGSGGRKSSGEGKMLRKGSKARQQQAEQAARDAAAINVPKQPPHLPSLNPLPHIASFGGEDARPASVAIFNSQNHSSNNYTTSPNTPARSGNAMNSSSPAYAYRPGNAFAQQAAASSSPRTNGENTPGSVDRAESMAHRGRYSYASSTAQVSNVNSPRRVRRRKDPTPFNVLVIGAKNSGKTSFISFLRHSLTLPANKQPYANDVPVESNTTSTRGSSSFTSHYLETEFEGERMGVTLWDSAGLEKHIIDLQLREMSTFVESKFEETFVEEQKVMRSPGAKDTHIHCVFLVLDPVRLDGNIAASQKGGAVSFVNASGLDEDLDLQVIRALWGKTTVIPVVSKADTLTSSHMSFLKRAVWDSLKSAKLDPLEALDLEADDEEFDDDEDEDDSVVNNLEDDSDYSGEDADGNPLPSKASKRTNTHNRQSSLANTVTSANGDETPYIPMSILSPDPYDLPPYKSITSKKGGEKEKVGRRFPWGFADPYDPEHCDFTRLRDSIFNEWRGDLRDLARTKWYENWRTSRLNNLPGTKQRVKGGVTPVGAVPKESRTSPPFARNYVAQQAGAVPRSVSGGAGSAVGGEERSTSKAERMMGMTPSDAQSVASGRVGGGGSGLMRGVESYQ